MTLEQLKKDESALVQALRVAGADVKGRVVRCPFCDDHRPSAGIYASESGWAYKCHKCGFQGSVIDVQAKAEGKTPSEVITSIVGRSVKHEPGLKVYPTLEALQSTLSNLKSVFKYDNPRTGKPDLVVFRIEDGDGKRFLQARPEAGGFVLQKPKGMQPLYNRARVEKADRVVVVEGEKCVHALHYFGIVATTSPGGCKAAKYADWSLLDGKRIVLWPDADDGGKLYADDVQNVLRKSSLYRINPAALGLKDGDDVVDHILRLEEQAKSRDQIQAVLLAILDAAEPIQPEGKVHNYLERCRNGQLRVIPLPWPLLDRLTRAMRPGTITLLCAGPGATKSFMLLQAIQHWYANGEQVAALLLEDSAEYHTVRMLAQRSDEPGIIDPNWNAENPELSRQIEQENADFIREITPLIHTSTEPMTLQQVGDWVESVAKDGAKIICIDPITAAMQDGFRKFDDESRFVARANKISVQYDTSLLILLHPAKNASVESVDELAGSASFGRFTHTVIKLIAHDDKESAITTPCGTDNVKHNRSIAIRKARNGPGVGKLLAFNLEHNLTLKEYGLIEKEKKGKK